MITSFLKVFGAVDDVRVVRDKETGESRRFAFVDFTEFVIIIFLFIFFFFHLLFLNIVCRLKEAERFVDYHKPHGNQIVIDETNVGVQVGSGIPEILSAKLFLK